MLAFDRETVDLDALQRAAYATARLMTVDIVATDSEYRCSLFPRDGSLEVDELAHRLRSEVVDQSLRLRIGRETESARNLILALAFSETGLLTDDQSSS